MLKTHPFLITLITVMGSERKSARGGFIRLQRGCPDFFGKDFYDYEVSCLIEKLGNLISRSVFHLN